jgi:hypothetical protein
MASERAGLMAGVRAVATPDESRREQAGLESSYDVTKAAPTYANIAGLVSTFALAAVVLVLLIAATATNPGTSQKVDMGFATMLFALGFLGCLLAAFAFASLGGAPQSAALVTNSMLVASIVALCLVAVLGGFAALAHAFLEQASAAFVVITAVTACLAPIFVWFPLFDIARDFSRDGLSGDREKPRSTARVSAILAAEERFISRYVQGRPFSNMSPEEKGVVSLLAGMTLIGIILASLGLVIHFSDVFGRPEQWEYYVLGFAGLLYTGLVIVGALILAADPDARLTPDAARLLNLVQCLFMLVLIAVLP